MSGPKRWGGAILGMTFVAGGMWAILSRSDAAWRGSANTNTAPPKVVRIGDAPARSEFPEPLPGEEPTGGYLCSSCKYHHGPNWGLAPSFDLRREGKDVKGNCPNCGKSVVWLPCDRNQEPLSGYAFPAKAKRG